MSETRHVLVAAPSSQEWTTITQFSEIPVRAKKIIQIMIACSASISQRDKPPCCFDLTKEGRAGRGRKEIRLIFSLYHPIPPYLANLLGPIVQNSIKLILG